MAKCSIKMNDEQCKDFIDRVFTETLGVDFNYVVQAVREKIERAEYDYHKYVHMETAKNEVHCGNYVTYKKCDRFFCERCLDIKEVEKVEKIEAYKGRPAWY